MYLLYVIIKKAITSSLCHCLQEVFVNECVQLLMARAPKALSQQGSERMGFTHDIVTAILSSLQPCIGLGTRGREREREREHNIHVHVEVNYK